LKQLSSFGIIPEWIAFSSFNSEYNSAFIVAITEVSSSESLKHLIFQSNSKLHRIKLIKQWLVHWQWYPRWYLIVGRFIVCDGAKYTGVIPLESKVSNSRAFTYFTSPTNQLMVDGFFSDWIKFPSAPENPWH
jgi:hypothetical protein